MNFSRLISKLRISGVRQFASVEGAAATAGEPGGAALWKKLSFFVAVPAIAVCALNVYLKEMEHAKHFHRPEFKPYQHLRLRNRKFPWGDGNHSLIHNPKRNALPTGYETDDKGNMLN